PSLAPAQLAQTPLKPAQMTPTLPLELQLHIFELALPPLIYRRLDERASLLQSLSLVTRSWTAWAQSQLHEHISILHEADSESLVRAMKRLEVKEAQGYPLKRVALYFDAGPDARAVMRDAPGIIGQAFEAWLISNERAVQLHRAVGLRRLHIFDPTRSVQRMDSHHLPAQLTYLALHSITLASTFNFERFPRLETLLLDQVPPSGPIEWLQQVRHTPVRVLCCKIYFPILDASSFVQLARLEHFALVIDERLTRYDFLPSFTKSECAVSLPPRLRTFTLYAASESASKAECDGLQALCSQHKTKLFLCVDASADVAYNWDTEEWAYSVGA
ncbi:Proteophosphoglycan ppg4, partial [Rhodotorula toruloides]